MPLSIYLKDFVDSHLDKLDALSKWVVIPKIVTGKDFPKDGRAFDLLKQLIANRNYIVHSKAAELWVYDERQDDLVISTAARKRMDFENNLEEKAMKAIQAMNELASDGGTEYHSRASFNLRAPVGEYKAQLDEIEAYDKQKALSRHSTAEQN